MKKIMVLMAALGLGGFCWGDLIRFVDDIELGGPDVEVLSRTNQRIDVRVKWGTVSLNTDRVKLVEIYFKARITKLIADGNDTPKRLFELGVLCDQSGMAKEASEAFALILRKQTVPEEMLKNLGGIFEKRELWPEAKVVYDKLLLTNPADPGLQAKANLCAEKAKGATPLKLDVELGKDPAPKPQEDPAQKPDNPERVEKIAQPGPDTTGPPKPDPAVGGRDGMEVNPLWQIEQWGNAATSEVVTQGEDNKLLNVTWTGKDKEKVALRLNVDMNFTDKTKVTFDVFNNSNSPAGVCLAFNTLPGFQFFESMAFDSQVKKWKTIEVDLAAKNYKCAASNWKYVAEIANKDNVKDIFILIYNRDAQGSLFIDNFRFHAADEK